MEVLTPGWSATTPYHAVGMVGPAATPAKLSLKLLCPMAVSDADGVSRLPRVRKTRAVLAVLGLLAPEPVTRAQLIALLWSRRDAPQAQGSLRQALRELSVTLGPAAGLLRIERSNVALDIAGLQVDVHTLEAAGPASPEGLALWQGTLLPDLAGLDPAFDRWVAARRQRLARRVREGAEAVLDASGGIPEQIAAAERLLALDPVHERAWMTLIRGHANSGDRTLALRCYDRYCAALSEQCQASPSADATALAASLRARTAAPKLVRTGPLMVVTSKWSRGARTRLRIGVASLRSGDAEVAVTTAAGLTEELLVALARCRWLAGVPCDARDARQDIDFLLTGALQMHRDRVRVLLRLTHLGGGGEVVWAERFEEAIDDIFALQDHIAATTVARLEARLWLWEGMQTGAHGAAPTTPRDLVRMAVPALYRVDRPSFMAAGGCLDRAVELDPEDVIAHVWAAQWYLFCVGQGWARDEKAYTRRAQDLAERAIQLDPDDARGLTLTGHVRGFINHRPEEALRLHERAIKANPNLPLSWCLSGLARCYVGECTEGTTSILRAKALSPDDPLSYFYEMALGVSYLLRGEFILAAKAGQRAIALNPGFSSSHKGYLAAIGHLGEGVDIRPSRARLLELENGFSVAQAMARSPIATREARALYADGLRAAGLP